MEKLCNLGRNRLIAEENPTPDPRTRVEHSPMAGWSRHLDEGDTALLRLVLPTNSLLPCHGLGGSVLNGGKVANCRNERTRFAPSHRAVRC